MLLRINIHNTIVFKALTILSSVCIPCKLDRKITFLIHCFMGKKNCNSKLWVGLQYQTSHQNFAINFLILKREILLNNSPHSRMVLYLGNEATVRTKQGKLTASKLGKRYNKTIYHHSAYFPSMHSISWEMLEWMNHKLESRLWGEISTTSDMHMTLLES